MTQPQGSDIDLSRPADRLAMWLALGAFVGYWWFMLRAMKGLVHEIAVTARWWHDALERRS